MKGTLVNDYMLQGDRSDNLGSRTPKVELGAKPLQIRAPENQDSLTSATLRRKRMSFQIWHQLIRSPDMILRPTPIPARETTRPCDLQ
ncbi:hypothetical protein Nepgr_011797 [Nepenthes gracilis]|uniref:Uncharacterized protein n=1 Tax=Nepenthes gracilis TaxID=150966 RepID=A0AAD3SGB7_NEPGR|nr:hypothetical protein Nepgr_011797 [Nepenthes gracilis]